jgi:hypothetical protein
LSEGQLQPVKDSASDQNFRAVSKAFATLRRRLAAFEGTENFLKLATPANRHLVAGLITIESEKAVIAVGTGFTAERTAKGKFTIKLTTELTETGVIVAKTNGGGLSVASQGKKEFKVETFNPGETELQDRTFNFIAIG